LFGRDTAENREEVRASEPTDLFVSTKAEDPGLFPGVFGFVGRDTAENREEVRASEPTDLFVSTKPMTRESGAFGFFTDRSR